MAKNEETMKTPEELMAEVEARVKAMTEEAEAKAKAIVEEAEKKAAQKVKEAEKAGGEKSTQGGAKGNLVPIRLFKDTGKYKDDLQVAINGKSWQIQRGVTVMVPDYVAQFIEQSLKQDLDTAIMMEKKQQEFEAETKNRGL